MTCYLCNSPSASACQYCGHVTVCDRHLNSHYYNQTCLPFTVDTTEDRGRSVIATRCLTAGDLILVDRPSLLTPPTRTRAQCLQCCRLVTYVDNYKCPDCGFPMCGPECSSGDLHKTECDILTKANFEADIEDLEVEDDHYAVILPLRCIQMKNKSKDDWSDFQSFLSHCDQRKTTNRQLWSYHQEHSVDFVRDTCELGSDWSDEEIHRILGLVEVNSLEVALPNGYGEQMGFYPVFANLNHSCLPNARPHKKADKTVEVMALVDIQKGVEITIQYVVETQPTRQRRHLLSHKWFFSCTCVRCSDPKECGTFLAALKCVSCKSPTSLPAQPLTHTSEYLCSQCGDRMSFSQVRDVFTQAEEDTKCDIKDQVEHLERFLTKYTNLLHPTNYVMLIVKMKLGCLYGNCQEFPMSSLTTTQLNHKKILCQEALVPLIILSRGVLKGATKWVSRLNREIERVDRIIVNNGQIK